MGLLGWCIGSARTEAWTHEGSNGDRPKRVEGPGGAPTAGQLGAAASRGHDAERRLA